MHSTVLRQGRPAPPSPGVFWLIGLLALGKLLLPFLLQHPCYELHRDEFLYMAEGRRLAWGYLEVPPLLSGMTAISNAFGGGLFWVRIWPALFGSLSYLLVARMILLLGGRRFALVLGFLPFVFGYLLHVHFILQPNFLEQFFWLGMAYGLVLYLRTGRTRGLYWLGICFGFGMLSKYSVVLFTGSLFAGLLLTPERKIFSCRHFWLALMAGFVLFLPNLVWQALHGWPVVTHMRELRQEQLDQLHRLDFWRDQLVFNLPGLVIWLAGGVWLFSQPAGKPFRFAGWAVLILLGLLSLAKGKSYYAMGVYPILFAFGAVWLEELTAGGRRVWRYGLVAWSIGWGVFIDMIALPMLPPAGLAAFYARHPIYRQLGFLRWEDQRDHALSQDFADMLGWEEMAMKTATVYESLDSLDRSRALLKAGGNYGEGGALDYYGGKYSLPGVVCWSASYLLWTPPDYYQREIFVVVSDNRSLVQADYRKKFSYTAIVDSITNPYAREYGSHIILMKGPNAEVRRRWHVLAANGK